ncbi:MAG: hypothetical protein GX589_00610, partial [Deltaproteobacteria bacterium]|nr:hypothetical protein [Deltaproteobacteria bacterium]
MAREYKNIDQETIRLNERRRVIRNVAITGGGALALAASPLMSGVDPALLFGAGLIPLLGLSGAASHFAKYAWLERERDKESARRRGKPVLGMPPQRQCFATEIARAQAAGKSMIDKYLVGFNLETGEPLWIDQEDLCSHACVFAKTGVGKTLWLESLIFQQMARGRASGCTFIDAKRDSGTLAQIIMMALVTGRIEDLIVIDPFDSVHAYNFVLTNQRADVKARKVLRAVLPPTSDQSTTKHYDRLAADSIYRMVRAMESFGLAWSIHDIAVAL